MNAVGMANGFLSCNRVLFSRMFIGDSNVSTIHYATEDRKFHKQMFKENSMDMVARNDYPGIVAISRMDHQLLVSHPKDPDCSVGVLLLHYIRYVLLPSSKYKEFVVWRQHKHTRMHPITHGTKNYISQS